MVSCPLRDIQRHSDTCYNCHMNTRTCTKCKQEKPEDKFSWRSKSRGTKQSWCKRCKQHHDIDYYQDTKDRRRKRKRELRKELREENQRNLYEYLKLQSCVDCGETDPLVLEFDHVRGKKKYNIAQMAHTHVWSSVLKEIAILIFHT